MGVEIARNLSEIFKDVPPGHPLFRRFSLITPEMVPEYEARLSRLAPTGRLPEEDSKAFLALALAYVEPRMRFRPRRPDPEVAGRRRTRRGTGRFRRAGWLRYRDL